MNASEYIKNSAKKAQLYTELNNACRSGYKEIKDIKTEASAQFRAKYGDIGFLDKQAVFADYFGY